MWGGEGRKGRGQGRRLGFVAFVLDTGIFNPKRGAGGIWLRFMFLIYRLDFFSCGKGARIGK